MTNEEKFATTEERVTAFREFCHKTKYCNTCPAHLNMSERKSGFGFDGCAIKWLTLEAESTETKEEKLKPCPFCGSEAILQKRIYGFGRVGFFVKCSNGECGIVQDFTSQTKEAAIADWNGRAQ